jgi:hypothetical protein
MPSNGCVHKRKSAGSSILRLERSKITRNLNSIIARRNRVIEKSQGHPKNTVNFILLKFLMEYYNDILSQYDVKFAEYFNQDSVHDDGTAAVTCGTKGDQNSACNSGVNPNPSSLHPDMSPIDTPNSS